MTADEVGRGGGGGAVTPPSTATLIQPVMCPPDATCETARRLLMSPQCISQVHPQWIHSAVRPVRSSAADWDLTLRASSQLAGRPKVQQDTMHHRCDVHSPDGTH